MATPRYNWGEIKQYYFTASEMEVEQFLRKHLAIDPQKALNGSLTKNTTGWRKEKEEFKKLQTENAVEKMAEDPDVIAWNQTLIKGKRFFLSSILKRVQTNNENLAMSELMTGLNAIKIELGEETTITKNNNLNTNYTLPAVINFTDI